MATRGAYTWRTTAGYNDPDYTESGRRDDRTTHATRSTGELDHRSENEQASYDG